MLTKILTSDFEPYTELQKLKSLKTCGAESIFIGHMRDQDINGEPISKMLIEHYPEMTERCLNDIAKNAIEKYSLADAIILHRVGEILPQQAIVLIACWSTHREASINASRFLIEALKSKVPFWKKEWQKDSSEWVSTNTTSTYDS